MGGADPSWLFLPSRTIFTIQHVLYSRYEALVDYLNGIIRFALFGGGHLENRSLRPPEGSKVKKNLVNELLSSIRTW